MPSVHENAIAQLDFKLWI